MPKKFYESHSLKCKMTGFKKDPALRCEECGKHCRDEKSFAFHKRYHKRKNEALANENEMDKGAFLTSFCSKSKQTKSFCFLVKKFD